jgi:hypothetical protein
MWKLKAISTAWATRRWIFETVGVGDIMAGLGVMAMFDAVGQKWTMVSVKLTVLRAPTVRTMTR